MASIGMIGGADGPTAVFVSGFSYWINLMGLILVVLLLIPNILYAVKRPGQDKSQVSKPMCLLEQLGRYCSMALMVFGFGFYDFGFASVASLFVYLIGNTLLIAAYYIAWVPFFRTQRPGNALVLAVLPAMLFLLSGICLEHWALAFAAILFGIGHIYVTARRFS